MKKLLIISFSALILFNSCIENHIFEKNQAIEGYSWEQDEKMTFEIHIDDTNARYNIYTNIRHTENYHFRNLWIMIHTQFPSGEVKKKRVELQMADKDGRWYGDCMGDICDIQVQIQKNALFPEKGTYTFTLEQIMRVDPLPYIMEAGIRVVKKSENNIK